MSEQIPQWAMARAYDLCAAEGQSGWHPDATRVFACYIAQHEQPPVDPDVIAVREIAAAGHEAEGGMTAAETIRSGGYDDRRSFQASLAAYRKHKEAGK